MLNCDLRELKLVLTSKNPYVLCKAGTTKNKKMAKQYIDVPLAIEFERHISSKMPGAPVFGIQRRDNMADMIRRDLAVARDKWLKETKDPAERRRRLASDYLAPVNHDGEDLVFHSLRHTCGAWLALAGEHPKTVQTVMRHASITLTMDTYGHLFPGQTESAPAKIREVIDGQVSLGKAG